MTKEQLMNYKEFGEHTDFVKKAEKSSLHVHTCMLYYICT